MQPEKISTSLSELHRDTRCMRRFPFHCGFYTSEKQKIRSVPLLHLSTVIPQSFQHLLKNWLKQNRATTMQNAVFPCF